MKRKLFAGLAVAGALTLWSSVASFARFDDEPALSPQAQAAINQIIGPTGCATTQVNNLLTGVDTSKYTADSVQEAVANATEKINGIASTYVDMIMTRFENWQEAATEANDSEDGTATLLPQPTYTDLVSAACSQIAGVSIDKSSLELKSATDNEGSASSDRDMEQENERGSRD